MNRNAVVSCLALLTLGTERAAASSAVEFPDNGVAQLSRGGAWLATATDPIAGFYNPAALATQTSSVGVGMNVALQEICFDRRGPGNAKIGPRPGFAAGGVTYEEVCADSSGRANLIPNVAGVLRLSPRFAIGLTLTPPASYGTTKWPEVAPTPGRSEPIPSPGRYLSLAVRGTILWPTLAAAYSITDELHVGAGFVAGIALLELESMSISNVQESNPVDDHVQDTRSKVNARDLFIPGAVASVLFEATPNLDFAAWGRVSDSIRAKGDLEVIAPYFTATGVRRTQCDYPGQTVDEPGKPCADTTLSKDQVGKDAAEVTVPVPVEIRIGARFHQPRPAATGLEAERQRRDAFRTRDPLRDDLFDVELDLTYARNSQADEIQIRFPSGINVLGLSGTVPENADRPTGYKDSFGARLGGQYNLRRSRLGLRAGTWIETPAVDDEYLTVTGVPALRGGVALGTVMRVQRVDLEVGYMHAWNAGLDNGGNGKLHAIAGSGSPDNRSYHTVNGGSVSQHADVFSLGGVVRF
ncbi:MAG: hypothetical protein R3B13_31170 [Polyangiaceae bacterium]